MVPSIDKSEIIITYLSEETHDALVTEFKNSMWWL